MFKLMLGETEELFPVHSTSQSSHEETSDSVGGQCKEHLVQLEGVHSFY